METTDRWLGRHGGASSPAVSSLIRRLTAVAAIAGCVQIASCGDTGDESTCHPNAYLGGPSMSPDGTKIVFGSPLSGNGDIYMMDADGSNWTPLTETSRSDCFPRFFPDGKKILFVSETDGKQMGELYEMDLEERGLRQLTHTKAGERDPIVSPDGRKAAYQRYALPADPCRRECDKIYVLDLETLNETPVAKTCQRFTAIHLVGFSPQSDRIYYERYGDCPGNPDGLWATQLDGSSPEVVLPQGSYPDLHTIVRLISPDGKNLLLSREDDLWTMQWDGSALRQLTFSEEREDEPSFSKDGELILFLGILGDYASGDAPIRILNVDTLDVTTVGYNFCQGKAICWKEKEYDRGHYQKCSCSAEQPSVLDLRFSRGLRRRSPNGSLGGNLDMFTFR